MTSLRPEVCILPFGDMLLMRMAPTGVLTEAHIWKLTLLEVTLVTGGVTCRQCQEMPLLPSFVPSADSP